MNYKPSTILFVQGALIAASYVALTIVFAPLSFMEFQVRISESLTILPVFTAAAVPGLTIGCFLSNILCGAPLPDVIFGSLATLVGAVGTRLLRNRSPVLAVLPPIISNMLVIPFVLHYAYGVPLPIPLLMVAIGIGETISCGALGLLLYKILFPHRMNIFK